ncbi:recombinase family protein [Kiloniella sp.]|uniref:recombinase family protein n=1 Tax=Kiloniella sp. TaxID=1938587 RepID=UPI003B026678
MKIGYARVSTKDQNLEYQIKGLKEAGCEEVYSEKVSGNAVVREELDKAMGILRKDDTFVVWKLDRLGRRTTEVLSFIEGLEAKGVKFQSISDGMDTSSSMGKAILMMAAVFAELERNLIIERTMRGLEIARENGKRPGPKEKVTDEDIEMAITLLDTPDKNGKRRGYAKVAKTLGVSKSTLSRRISGLRDRMDA